MVGFEFRGLAVVMELKARRSHGGLQHLSFPVVDGDLQVTDVRWHRWKDGLWRIYYSTNHTQLLDYYRCCGSMRELSFPA